MLSCCRRIVMSPRCTCDGRLEPAGTRLVSNRGSHWRVQRGASGSGRKLPGVLRPFSERTKEKFSPHGSDDGPSPCTLRRDGDAQWQWDGFQAGETAADCARMSACVCVCVCV